MDREVQLPHTTNNDITEVLDVSPIYIFYDETKPDSVDFNRRNMISTTNWLVNIDKRLTLKQVLPHLQYLQAKRRGDAMHKNENAKNYFTCFNPETESLSFIDFTELRYEIISGESVPYRMAQLRTKDEYRLDASYHAASTLSIRIDHNNNKFFDNSLISIDELREKLNYFVKEYNFLGFNIECFFDQKLSFQDYVTAKSELNSLQSETISFDIKEYIHN
jgi:biopolymer transport protein ExbD